MDTGKAEQPADDGTRNVAPTADPPREFSAMRELRESARLTTDALCDAGRKATAAVREVGEGAYDIGSRTGAQVVHQMETWPIASLLVAATVGMIAGMLLARR